MGKTPKYKVDTYIRKQERRVEALDLINQIAALDSQAPTKKQPESKPKDKKDDVEAAQLGESKKKNKKNKKKKNKKTDGQIQGQESQYADAEDSFVKETDANVSKSIDDALTTEKQTQVDDVPKTSTFIDNRGAIKGFANIPKVSKKKRSYTWKEKLAEEERKRRKIAEEEFFESSSEEDNVAEEGEEQYDRSDEDIGKLSGGELGEESDQENMSEEEEEEEEGEEFTGFSDNDDGTNTKQKDNNSDEEVSESEESEESGDEEDDDSEEDDGLDERQRLKILNEKASSFMNWIEERTEKPAPTPILDIDYKPLERKEDKEALSDEEEIPIYETNKEESKPAFFVHVERDPEIQEMRSELPVFKEEHKIMEAIKHHDTVIICGETGSGKTTQLPQFLFEAGYGDENSENPGIIGVTQPRRVAAMSMAERVSSELGNHGHKVAYQIRFISNVKKETKVKFMTDGVLLREMMTDFLLTKYSAIIIDEAHERNINTDILIGMLSRIVKLRARKYEEDSAKYKKLKLIVMSATLRVSDFSENENLFSIPPPILKVDARMYPVAVHFNKKTPYDYLNEAFRKTCKIHQKLPRGGILIFLTSQQEIMQLVKQLRERFPMPSTKRNKKLLKGYNSNTSIEMKVSSKEADVEDEEIEFDINEDDTERKQGRYYEDDVKEKLNDNESDNSGDEEDDKDEEEGFEEVLEEGQTEEDPLYVLPLYSLLPTKEQMKVFEKPPGNARICIVATNIAETSITIPNIKYVVDCGRSKQKVLSKNSVQSYEVSWISQASAEQRSGRAGRTGPGHTYRLFSSAVFDEFEKFSIPEILRMPIESVILQMKSIGIDNIVNFPFPTPVDPTALHKAEKLLQYLGALDENKVVTETGKSMSLFPLNPRFAKMLLISNQFGCLPYIITIVCGLSVGDPFLSEVDIGINHNIINADLKDLNDEEEDDATYNKKVSNREKMKELLEKYNKAKAIFYGLDKYSDALKLLCAVSAADYYKDSTKKENFLKDHFIRPKIIEEINKLRKQLLYIVKINTLKDNIGADINYDKELRLVKPPSKIQINAIKQIIATGFLDQIAIRGDIINPDIKLTTRSSVSMIPYSSLFPATDSFKQQDLDPFVYVHPSSIISNAGEKPPSYIVYQSLDLNSTNTRIRMRPLTDIEGKALTNIAKGTTLLGYSKPLGPPYGPEMITPTKQKCFVIPRFGGIGASISWDLPPIRVIQNKVNGQWVTQ